MINLPSRLPCDDDPLGCSLSPLLLMVAELARDISSEPPARDSPPFRSLLEVEWKLPAPPIPEANSCRPSKTMVITITIPVMGGGL